MIRRVLGVSPSGCHAWRRRPASGCAVANRALPADIRTVDAGSGGACGAPRGHAHLRAHGRRVGRHRIARLMRRAGLRGLAAIPHRVRTTDRRHDHPIAPNRLRRNVMAAAPNQVRLADPTYVGTGEGWRSRGFRGPAGATVPAHLAALIDRHIRKPSGPCFARNGPPGRFVRAGPDRSASVGWAVRDTLHAGMALEALEMALERQRPAPGFVHDGDRGVQHAADACRQALAAGGITPSMSRKGNRLANAPTESFFHTLEVERIHHRVHATRAEARRDLCACIEGFYNSQRLHSAIGRRSPADMERMAA